MNNTEIQKIMHTMLSHIINAGKITQKYFIQYIYNTKESKENTHVKTDKSPVTIADKQTEHFLRKTIMKHYPEHGIIGEEFNSHQSTARYQWVLDPIDGTKTFIRGVPLYTILVGLIDTQSYTPILGCIYAPQTGECVYACKNTGAFFIQIKNSLLAKQKKAIRIQSDTTTKTLHDSLLISYDWISALKENKKILDIMQQAAITRTWADGYAYILLSTGRAQAIIDAKMHAWDILPIYTILQESNCIIKTFNNEQLDIQTLLEQAKPSRQTSTQKNSTEIECNVISAANTNIMKAITSILET